jgi:hypothetical protein
MISRDLSCLDSNPFWLFFNFFTRDRRGKGGSSLHHVLSWGLLPVIVHVQEIVAEEHFVEGEEESPARFQWLIVWWCLMLVQWLLDLSIAIIVVVIEKSLTLSPHMILGTFIRISSACQF